MTKKPLSLTSVSKRLRKLSEEIEESKQRFKDKEKDIISRCPHNFTYHPDPSGNNDSGYCCSACQTWVSRLP